MQGSGRIDVASALLLVAQRSSERAHRVLAEVLAAADADRPPTSGRTPSSQRAGLARIACEAREALAARVGPLHPRRLAAWAGDRARLEVDRECVLSRSPRPSARSSRPGRAPRPSDRRAPRGSRCCRRRCRRSPAAGDPARALRRPASSRPDRRARSRRDADRGEQRRFGGGRRRGAFSRLRASLRSCARRASRGRGRRAPAASCDRGARGISASQTSNSWPTTSRRSFA